MEVPLPTDLEDAIEDRAGAPTGASAVEAAETTTPDAGAGSPLVMDRANASEVLDRERAWCTPQPSSWYAPCSF